MEIKKYVLLEDNSIMVWIGFNDWVQSSSGKVIATSDNILELAREGDLVRSHGDIYELFGANEELVFEVNEELVFYPDKEQENITMLYKKVGNNFIGYEVN